MALRHSWILVLTQEWRFENQKSLFIVLVLSSLLPIVLELGFTLLTTDRSFPISVNGIHLLVGYMGLRALELWLTWCRFSRRMSSLTDSIWGAAETARRPGRAVAPLFKETLRSDVRRWLRMSCVQDNYWGFRMSIWYGRERKRRGQETFTGDESSCPHGQYFPPDSGP